MNRSLALVFVFSTVPALTTAIAVADDPVELLTAQESSGDLAGWTAFSEDPNTPTGDVWKLTDDGVLVCSGSPKGYIYTEKDHTDFVLTLRWRWPPGEPGRGGVLLRTTGEHKIWPKSLEAQINADDAGDFWGLDGYSLDGPAERLKTIDSPEFGRLTNLKKTAAAEKPPGEWNSYKITARGDTVTLVVNGKTVNRATGCEVAPGKICLTAEGSEIHFRNVRLAPVGDSKN